MRSGFVALVGRPNVGKSTLLNALVRHKVAITTSVPQTTRHAIRGVLHRDDAQVVFVDTPGIHKPRTLLGRRLNDVARASLTGVDLVLFLVDAARGIGRGDEYLAELLTRSRVPVIAVLNKTDAISRAAQLPALQRLSELGEYEQIVPVAALTGDAVDVLEGLIVERMPEGPAFFPPEQITDQTVETRVAETIREKAITLMREEVPHSIAVVVEEMGPGRSPGVTAVTAVLYVERETQKGIVIGQGGAVLRDIGVRARTDLEELLGAKVYLDLRVKLSKEWQRDPRKLQRLGY